MALEDDWISEMALGDNATVGREVGEGMNQKQEDGRTFEVRAQRGDGEVVGEEEQRSSETVGSMKEVGRLKTVLRGD